MRIAVSPSWKKSFDTIVELWTCRLKKIPAAEISDAVSNNYSVHNNMDEGLCKRCT